MFSVFFSINLSIIASSSNFTSTAIFSVADLFIAHFFIHIVIHIGLKIIVQASLSSVFYNLDEENLKI